MKNIINYALLLVGMLSLFACVEEERTVISENPLPPALIFPSNGQAIVLSKESATENLRFTFDPSDFGFSAAVTYTVQLGEAGTTFANPLEIGSSNGGEILISQELLNQRLLGRGFEPEQAIPWEVRVRASLSESVPPLFSPIGTLMLTPFSDAVELPRLFVPGDYQGWSVENLNTVIFSLNNNNVYEGFVHILGGSGQFKVTEQPNWDINYGGADGVLERNGPDLRISEPFGTFSLKIDLTNLTYEIGPRRRWGIIGDATPFGWDADTPMNFDANENVLTITMNLSAGKFKFRAGDWAFNYGDNGADGTLEPNGADILITEAGNYTIIMDWKIPGQLTYQVKKN
jgi:starch-binding outer membrane protein SusE/F